MTRMKHISGNAVSEPCQDFTPCRRSVVVWLLVFTGFACLFPVSPATAKEPFALLAPDLSEADACARAARGDAKAATACYKPFNSICLNNHYEHYLECLPQEAAFWRKTLDGELAFLSKIDSDAGDGARRIDESVKNGIKESCTDKTAKLRHMCQSRYYHLTALELRINLIWMTLPSVKIYQPEAGKVFQ